LNINTHFSPNFNSYRKSNSTIFKTLALSMASKKKQSEGIALLSMYNDNSDDEMEDAEEEEDNEMRGEEQDEAAEHATEEDLTADTDRMTVTDSGNEVAGDGFTPTERSRTPQVNRLFSPLQEQQKVELKISRSATLTIVDYGHDEVAMSPEPEVIFFSLSSLRSLG
jgi:hypothetical protein